MIQNTNGKIQADNSGILCRSRQIRFRITLFNNCEHVNDYFPCEYQGRTTEQQYSIAIGLVFCIFATKYVIELKDIARGIRRVIMIFFVMFPA